MMCLLYCGTQLDAQSNNRRNDNRQSDNRQTDNRQTDNRQTDDSQTDDKKKDKKKIPPVEVVEIKTKDKVVLEASFYGSINEKEAVPVILLHDWDGNRTQMETYAESLQKQGFAVIVPDLRGHGNSMFMEDGTELKPDKWKPAEIATAVADIEACKKFLVGKNNEGELNIDQLSVVAEGVSCIHAVRWTISDWQFGDARGYLAGIKQGKDVKSLVLMGPPKSYRSMNLSQDLKSELFSSDDNRAMPIFILGDQDRSEKSVRESKALYTTLKRKRNVGKNSRRPNCYYFVYYTKEQRKLAHPEDWSGDKAELAAALAHFINGQAERFKDSNRWQDRSRN